MCPSVELYHSRKHTCWMDVKLMFSLSFGSWAKMMLTHLPLWQKSIPIYPFIFRHQFRSIFWDQHQLAWKNTNIAPDFMGQYLGQRTVGKGRIHMDLNHFILNFVLQDWPCWRKCSPSEVNFQLNLVFFLDNWIITQPMFFFFFF